MIIQSINYFKNENRFLVTLENSSFYVLENTLTKFNLFKGKEICSEDIENIKTEDKRYYAKDLAVKFLSNMKTEKEVRDHLKRNNVDEDIIDDTIFYLTKEKFIDDYEYALLFSRDKLNINKYGKYKIKISLQQKGVDNNIIENALLELPDDTLYENLKNAALKKHNSLGNDKKSYEKLVRHLLYKGYNYDQIKDVLQDIKDEL